MCLVFRSPFHPGVRHNGQLALGTFKSPCNTDQRPCFIRSHLLPIHLFRLGLGVVGRNVGLLGDLMTVGCCRISMAIRSTSRSLGTLLLIHSVELRYCPEGRYTLLSNVDPYCSIQMAEVSRRRVWKLPCGATAFRNPYGTHPCRWCVTYAGRCCISGNQKPRIAQSAGLLH